MEVNERMMRKKLELLFSTQGRTNGTHHKVVMTYKERKVST